MNTVFWEYLNGLNRSPMESADNVVWCCRSCNSSKGARDFLHWYEAKGEFPPLLLLRRYMKMAIAFAEKHGLMDKGLSDTAVQGAPYAYEKMTRKFPPLGEMKLWCCPLDGQF